MSGAFEDVAVVRLVLACAGTRDGSPAAEAFDRLAARALRYEWALPLLTGEDTPEANDRTRKVAAELLRGTTGEAALIAAMRS